MIKASAQLDQPHYPSDDSDLNEELDPPSTMPFPTDIKNGVGYSCDIKVI